VICFCAICCTAISINATDGKSKFRTGMPTIEIDFSLLMNATEACLSIVSQTDMKLSAMRFSHI